LAINVPRPAISYRHRQLALDRQNRMPAPHPPKAAPFVALPLQPNIPHPASSVAIPRATIPWPRRRQLRAVHSSCPDCFCITSHTFCSIKHLTIIQDFPACERGTSDPSHRRFGILTFDADPAKRLNASSAYLEIVFARPWAATPKT
jgi:hypothetical protein